MFISKHCLTNSDGVFFKNIYIDSYTASDIVYEWIPGEVQFGNKELSQFQLKGSELTSKMEVFSVGEHNILCFFISRSSSLSIFFLVELLWPVANFLFFFLYLLNLWTWQLIKLKTLCNTETISTFRFRLYWLLSCLCFTRSGWLSVFPPNNLELH